MKKRNMTKLALMGITIGLMGAGQAAAVDASQGVQIARGGCGSKCGSNQPSRDRRYPGQVADNTEETIPDNAPNKSCSGKQSCNGQVKKAPNEGKYTSQNEQNDNQRTASCSGKSSCNGQKTRAPQGSCSARSNSY